MVSTGRQNMIRARNVTMNDPATLEATVERFCRFITALPADALVEQAWGPKEVLAHLVYHHELYVTLTEGFVHGAPVAPPRGYGRELNAAAVAASRGVSVATLVARFRTATRQLVQLYRQHDPGAIPVEVRAGAKLRTLATLVPEAEAHTRNHLRKLRAAFKAYAGSDTASP
jgi:hypothetical protein